MVNENISSSTPSQQQIIAGSYGDVTSRKIREDTCRKFTYQVGSWKDERCHIANYRSANGSLVSQKIRLAGKKFLILGDGRKSLPLYGQNLWNSGKSVVITEGEIDAMSVSQAFDNKWPVVSLPNGAQGAVKAIERAYEWLGNFERIVLCFDNDEPGQKAAQEVAEILPAGKAFIMTLDRKDANEVLIKDGAAPIVSAFWNAKAWRPDGIVSGSELTVERLTKATARGYSLPFQRLDDMLHGLREQELTLLTAGSGVGKSTLAREIAYWLHQCHGLIIGNIFLEESIEKTAQGYVAIHNNVKLGELREKPSMLSPEQWDRAMREVIHERMYFDDHFGSLDSKRLIQKMRYMRKVLGVNFIILDHLSIVISGNEASSEGERRDIDRLMTNLRSLIEETGVGIVALVHLRQPEGTPHEEGGRVTLSQLRGSGSLKQLSDTIIAIERDSQDEEHANEARLRILKSRELGVVGEADLVEYDHETGRLRRLAAAFDNENEDKIDGKIDSSET